MEQLQGEEEGEDEEREAEAAAEGEGEGEQEEEDEATLGDAGVADLSKYKKNPRPGPIVELK
jgi:hypothetical protein